MSSYRTHSLIGLVAGYGLVRGLTALGHAVPFLPTAAITVAPTFPATVAALGSLALVGGSAFLSLLSDIDEPNSWIGRRVQFVVALAGLLLGVLAGVAWRGDGLGVASGLAGGLAAGIVGGRVLLHGIRTAAGGHRRFTHSGVLAGLLVAGAGVLVARGALIAALIPAALAWGIAVHVVGDLVTPGGVPLLYPFSARPLRVLPWPLCQQGERIVAVVAAGAFALLLWR